jgi:hypothetical protein
MDKKTARRKKIEKALKAEKKKPSRSRKLIGWITQLPPGLWYLVGEEVRVTESLGGVYRGVIRRPGYEGVEMAFDPAELTFERPPQKVLDTLRKKAEENQWR